jgi:phosphoribosylamine-glycine ligase
MRHRKRWHVLEYNVRLGVTSAVMILRMLHKPCSLLHAAARNQPLTIRFRPGLRYGASITLAGYGYPYVKLDGPQLPVTLRGRPECDIWWNEVAQRNGRLIMTGHRIADVAAVAGTLQGALRKAYLTINRIHCLGSYHRLDIGQSLWPPGES